MAPHFTILANNGFNYEYVTVIQARNALQARKEFERKYAGDHRTEDFKVRKLELTF
jgi:hypothetical protein